MEGECQSKLALRRVVLASEWDMRNLHLVSDSVIGVTMSKEWPCE